MPVIKNSDSRRRYAIGGFFVRRECWTLSWKARLILFIMLVAAGVLYVTQIQSFLATTGTVKGEFLIVEGWIPEYALRQAKTLFETGGYQKIFTCGTPIANELSVESQSTYADRGADRLIKCGVPVESVQAIPAGSPRKDRTFASALAVKNWMDQQNIAPSAVDVVTLGSHARRSRMMFQKAFGPKVKVGVASIANTSYDSKHWWRTSAGVREILDESIAYVYAMFFVRLD